MSTLWRFPSLAVLFALGAVSCGEQYVEPIRAHCDLYSTKESCLANADQGCSFQPNPIGCRSFETCAAGVCSEADAYVRRDGELLKLKGRPYRFLGVVSWGVAAYRSDCTFLANKSATLEQHRAYLKTVFDEFVDMKIDVLRFWAFQRFAGKTGNDFAVFDAVVDEARRAGVRLIPVLENMWDGCTDGADLTLPIPRKPESWFESGYAAPYGFYQLSYRQYVQGFAEHYRNEPTILAFELMHEAQGTSVDVLSAFVSDMVHVVRVAAPNHLVIAGLDNGQSSATSTATRNYYQLSSSDDIGLIDIHDFDNEESELPKNADSVVQTAYELRKPWFVGASAVRLGVDGTGQYAFAERASRVETKLQAALNGTSLVSQAAGFLIYDYQPGWQERSYPFDVRDGELVDDLLRSYDIVNP